MNTPTLPQHITEEDSAKLRLEALRLLSIHRARLERHRKMTAKQWGDAVKEAKTHLDETMRADVPEDADEARTHLMEAMEAYESLNETANKKKAELEKIDAEISQLAASGDRILHSSHDPNDPQQGLDLDDTERPLSWMTTDDIALVRSSLDDGRRNGMATTPTMEALQRRLREVAKDRN